jgi:hypothetical protein
MNSWPELDRFLRTDPRDAGCAKAMELLHRPCAEDLAGLLTAIRADLTEGSYGI